MRKTIIAVAALLILLTGGGVVLYSRGTLWKKQSLRHRTSRTTRMILGEWFLRRFTLSLTVGTWITMKWITLTTGMIL